MKKLLLHPSSDKKSFRLHGVICGEQPETTETKTYHSDKLPWLSTLASTLKDHKPDSLATNRHEESRHRELIGTEDEVDVRPREPEGPRPSGSVANVNQSSHLNPSIQVKKGMKFQAYKSTRPDLLNDLNKLIADGLQSIAKSYPHLFSPQASPHHKFANTNGHLTSSVSASIAPSPSNNPNEQDASLYSAERLRVYATAFQRFIDESTIYQRFLQDTKDTYDAYIIELLDKLSAFNTNVVQTSRREVELSKQLVELDEVHQHKLDKINEKVRLLESRIQSIDVEKSLIEADCAKSKDQMIQMRREYDEMKGTCVTLTNGLSRMEDEHRSYQNNEAGRLTELTYLRASEQKLNEEIERLQQVVQNMEQIQSSMVNQDVVNNLESTVDTLRAELKRLDGTHRQLLVRYASLKGIVDDCFKRFEQESNLGVAEEMKPKIAAIIDESIAWKTVKKIKKCGTMDPVEKIIHLMDHGGNPKIIIEVLLDHITSASNRHRQGLGNIMDNDREITGTGIPEGASGKIGTVTFEGEDGVLPMAEEFRSPWSHFDGLGYSESVPSYLKFHGKLQNLYLSKKETIRTLQEIWEAKLGYDQHVANQVHFEAASLEAMDNHGSNGSEEDIKKNLINFTPSLVSESLVTSLPINPNMATFFEHYLMDKFDKNRQLAVEMAYNLLDAVKRFSAVSDCRMFSAVLDNKLPMEIWADQRQLIERIKDEIQKEIKLMKSTSTENNDDSGKITSDQLIRLLRRVLPTKTEHAFSKLSKALALDNQAGRFINPKEILSEDDHGNRSHFLEQLKLQHINEAVSFEKHVVDCIDQFTDAGEKEMTVAKYRDALNYADPNKSRADINKLLARGCCTTVEEILLMEAKRIPIPIEDFKKKLRSGLLQKSAPIQGKKT